MDVVKPEQYREMLLKTLEADENDPAFNVTIQVLEDLCLALNYTLPVVRLPEHFYHYDRFVYARGEVRFCKCNAEWPCPLAGVETPHADLITDPGPTIDLRECM